VHLVARKNGADHLLVDLGECEAHGLGDDNAAAILALQHH
jgi:hypothetical protein